MKVGTRKLSAFYGALAFATLHLGPALIWRPSEFAAVATGVGSILTVALGFYYTANGYEWKTRLGSPPAPPAGEGKP